MLVVGNPQDDEEKPRKDHWNCYCECQQTMTQQCARMAEQQLGGLHILGAPGVQRQTSSLVNLLATVTPKPLPLLYCPEYLEADQKSDGRHRLQVRLCEEEEEQMQQHL